MTELLSGTLDSLVGRASRAYRRVRPNAVTGGGERVDIDLTRRLRERRLDMYQLSHLRRYQFAASLIAPGESVGDLACGTGYGSILLSREGVRVIGVDRDADAVERATARYRSIASVDFLQLDLLQLPHVAIFDTVVSFETVEHFPESDVLSLLALFRRALKPGGKLIFSTPYLQENSAAAQALGFHQTFQINEDKISDWLDGASFAPPRFYYQSYAHHDVEDALAQKDFIICVAKRPS
jgi:2-polyprenyl-3-methyl-5-hydroxy-6-metoxy-1,4-benzoquinol methylase